jgi:hypothetical protein
MEHSDSMASPDPRASKPLSSPAVVVAASKFSRNEGEQPEHGGAVHFERQTPILMGPSSPLRNDRFDDFDQPDDDMIDKSYNELVNQKNFVNPTKDSEECLFNFMSLRKKSGAGETDGRSSSPVGEVLS